MPDIEEDPFVVGSYVLVNIRGKRRVCIVVNRGHRARGATRRTFTVLVWKTWGGVGMWSATSYCVRPADVHGFAGEEECVGVGPPPWWLVEHIRTADIPKAIETLWGRV